MVSPPHARTKCPAYSVYYGSPSGNPVADTQNEFHQIFKQSALKKNISSNGWRILRPSGTVHNSRSYFLNIPSTTRFLKRSIPSCYLTKPLCIYKTVLLTKDTQSWRRPVSPVSTCNIKTTLRWVQKSHNCSIFFGCVEYWYHRIPRCSQLMTEHEVRATLSTLLGCSGQSSESSVNLHGPSS